MKLVSHGNDFLADGRAIRDVLDAAGVLLVRDPAIDLARFAAVSDAIGTDFSAYEGGANAGRAAVDDTGTIFPATGQEHGYAIPMHAEMHYLAKRPALLFFYCEQPATTGGETLLCDGPALADGLPAPLRSRFTESPIVYSRRLASGTWQTLYRTDSAEAVHAACARQGVQCHYDADTDSVTTRYACPALVETSRGLSFSNNFLPFAMRELGASQPLTSHVRFVDQEDRPIPSALIRSVLETAERLSVPHHWQRGDVLVLDNLSVLHGRPAIQDKARRILLRIAGSRRAH
jgi:alpha-ketoglutarate-dependent taurine dioxygenase